MALAMSVFVVIVAITYGTLGNLQQQVSNNVGLEQATEAGMLAMNQVATEVRDVSNSYLNSVQGQDGGTADIVSGMMTATELEFLSADNIVVNDAAGIVDPSGGSFSSGCANLIDIKLVSGNLVQTQTAPTLSGGQCTWSATPSTVTLVRNVEPLCSGSPCLAASPGATIFTYLQAYPNQALVATTPVQVGEVTVGFAVAPSGSSRAKPVVITQTVRLAAVLADPSS
jgi:hypothetical protein